MKNLFDPNVLSEIISRIEKLETQTTNKWGKMNVSQMMAHCSTALRVPLGDDKPEFSLLGFLIGRFFKYMIYKDQPYGKSSPTSPKFVILDKREFDHEKKILIENINRFYNAGRDGIAKVNHSFFGKFTADDWAISSYKHLNHHLTQFGV